MTSTRDDGVASLEQTVHEELLARCRLLLTGRTAGIGTVLDLGARSGAALPGLRATCPEARLLACDPARPMLREAQRHLASDRRDWLARWWPGSRRRGADAALCADAARLPLRAASVDVVYSSLALQSCDDLDAALREVRRVLRPEGLFVFATLGPDTLRELRAAWSQAGGRPPAGRFIDMHDVGDALLRCGFREPVLDVDRLRTAHADARALMRDLQDRGALTATAARGRGLTGRRRFEAVCAAYPRAPGAAGIEASWEVVYGSAFAGTEPARRPEEFLLSADRLAQSLATRRGGDVP